MESVLYAPHRIDTRIFLCVGPSRKAHGEGFFIFLMCFESVNSLAHHKSDKHLLNHHVPGIEPSSDYHWSLN